MARSFTSRAFVGSSPPSTAVLQALRTFYNFWIVTGHTTVFTSVVLGDLVVLDSLSSTSGPFHRAWNELTRVAMWAAVDTFLFVSGFFLAASLAKASGDDGRGNLRFCAFRMSQVPTLMVSRWLRLIPPYLSVAVMMSLSGNSSCVAWTELFFTGNLIRYLKGDMEIIDRCVVVGWSLSVDFQSHFIIAVLAAVLNDWQSLSSALWVLALGTSALRVSTWQTLGVPRMSWPAVVDYFHTNQQWQDFANLMGTSKPNASVNDPYNVDRRQRVYAYGPVYHATLSRMAPVCIGVIAWIALRNNTPLVKRIRRAPKLSLFISGILSAAYYFGTVAFVSESAFSKFLYLYTGFGRLGLALATAIVTILTCWVGKDKEMPAESTQLAKVLRSVLSNGFMLWLSRSTYAVFLIHHMIAPVMFHGWPHITAENYTAASNNWGGLKWYCASLVAALPLCLIEEAALTLRKRVLQSSFRREKTS